MLLELRAENYAVIDRAVATFGLGLNLLTGETGAGKSILIDALALLLGGKASPDVVRHGADKAVVSCVFELTLGAAAILEANGIDSESDHILLRREIVATHVEEPARLDVALFREECTLPDAVLVHPRPVDA